MVLLERVTSLGSLVWEKKTGPPARTQKYGRAEADGHASSDPAIESEHLK